VSCVLLRLALGPKHGGSFVQQELALESLCDFATQPAFATEMYANYDCEITCGNTFEELATMLSRTAIPVNSPSPPPTFSPSRPSSTSSRASPAACSPAPPWPRRSSLPSPSWPATPSGPACPRTRGRGVNGGVGGVCAAQEVRQLVCSKFVNLLRYVVRGSTVRGLPDPLPTCLLEKIKGVRCYSLGLVMGLGFRV